ncbi:hypothetical protein HDU67_008143 [Dinochytrium kinnereticum]|nr:hypothetical protein HDU67_008143 [Dinochytrium kinnereticum]
MIHNGTDWNRHHGVGATLLENWVEERAVGERNILDERASIAHLSKQGHKDILTHVPAAAGGHGQPQPASQSLKTTHQATFTASSPVHHHPTANRHSSSSSTSVHNHHPTTLMGKRRALIEAELMKRAMEELKEPPVDRSSAEWISTAHQDYAANGFSDGGRGRGAAGGGVGRRGNFVGVSGPQYGWDVQGNVETSPHFDHPITFWSDHATKGAGTVICSSKTNELQATGGVRFGKHAAFSTPIKEYNKGDVKNV